MFGKPKNLKQNLDRLKTMREKVSKCKTELEEAKENLVQSMADLEAKWATPAGKIYIEKIKGEGSGMSWAYQASVCAIALEELEALIKIAEDNYKLVTDEVEKLSLE